MNKSAFLRILRDGLADHTGSGSVHHQIATGAVLDEDGFRDLLRDGVQQIDGTLKRLFGGIQRLETAAQSLDLFQQLVLAHGFIGEEVVGHYATG